MKRTYSQYDKRYKTAPHSPNERALKPWAFLLAALFGVKDFPEAITSKLEAIRKDYVNKKAMQGADQLFLRKLAEKHGVDVSGYFGGKTE